jgi:hypothetical protein
MTLRAAGDTSDYFIYEELHRSAEKRRIPSTQILHEESLAIFEAWKTQPNKQPY